MADLKIFGGSELIWVLDDDNAIAEMEKRMLQCFGYHVKFFNRYDHFLNEFKKNGHGVDLVNTDMTRPYAGMYNKSACSQFAAQSSEFTPMLQIKSINYL